ncbi:hypothetical protein LCGC14_1343980 [marine sediment metagenome]|uniref:Uncharacterized protein n=1 Tax=marine sediment metagenome TaxID=412755 RepID=A0A0F9KDI9_9ZZZZ
MKKILLAILITVFVIFSMGSISRRYNPVTALAYYAVDTASNDTYLAQIDGIGGYNAGLFVLLNPVTDNTGACTLNINSLGAQSLKTVSGNDPADNHIDASQIVPLCYDGSNFVIMSSDANPP